MPNRPSPTRIIASFYHLERFSQTSQKTVPRRFFVLLLLLLLLLQLLCDPALYSVLMRLLSLQ
jgi:hypothetical protein